MKRRDAIRLMPLSMAVMVNMTRKAFSHEMPVGQYRGCQHEPLAIRYTKKVRERLRFIRETQSEDLMEASYAIARTVENGGSCWNSWDAGHTSADLFPGRNGEPKIFINGYNPNKTRDGDLVLARAASKTICEDVAKKDIFVVGAPSPWSGDAKYPELLRDEVREQQVWPYADVWIETNATTLGGVMYIPGMPAPVGPVTGVTGPVTIWMMIADACRILARRGISLPVKGDEPKVTGEKVDWRSFSGWVSLNDPLMDNYFDEAIKQIEMIGAELGMIRKIARMSVDTLLGGGKLYCYSRYNSISGEANTRRSGLSITTGLHDSKGTLWNGNEGKPFKGSSKDCVIMGITKPDDEMDLKYLDIFKKSGMKTASLGPMMRNTKVPEGRTVPKETDFHAGRLCDTYGLFAIPGFDQKVCPTSGVILNQLFWATIMEIIEQYIDRTGGDVPDVYFSAALKGGREHMHRMHELKREGGY